MINNLEVTIPDLSCQPNQTWTTQTQLLYIFHLC